MDVFQLVADGLAKRLGIEPDVVTRDSELSTLGVDSLDAAELLMDLEDALGVEIEPTKKIKTVDDLLREIEAAMN